MCIIDYEHTQSTKAGAPGVDPGQLITESRLFPQRQTDVATDAPRRDREVKADRVLFVGERRLKRCSCVLASKTLLAATQLLLLRTSTAVACCSATPLDIQMSRMMRLMRYV